MGTEEKSRLTVHRPLMTGIACLMLGFAAGLLANSSAQRIQIPIEDIQFSEPDGPAEMSYATVWGDPAKGPSSWVVTMKKGSTPPHPDISDSHVVIIKGTMLVQVQGVQETPKPLRPGSYIYGVRNQVTQTTCLTDECMAFAYYPEQVVPADAH